MPALHEGKAVVGGRRPPTPSASRTGHDVRGVVHKVAADAPKTINAAELAEKHIPAQRWIVPSFIPEGVTLLVGAPKRGKSWLVLQLALAAAMGQDFAGLAKAREVGALYMALEDGERRLKERQKKLLTGSAPPGLYYATSWRPFDDGGLEDLEVWLDHHPDVGLVIIDVIGAVRKQNRVGKNVYDEDYAAIRQVRELASTRNIAVVLVHHTNKGDSTDALMTVSGSNGLTGAVDAVIVLQREHASSQGTLSITGRDIDARELDLSFDDGRWRFLPRESGQQLPLSKQAVVDAIKMAGHPLRPKEVADQIGKSHETIKKSMQRMASGGYLVKLRGGRYSPSEDDAETGKESKAEAVGSPEAAVPVSPDGNSLH